MTTPSGHTPPTGSQPPLLPGTPPPGAVPAQHAWGQTPPAQRQGWTPPSPPPQLPRPVAPNGRPLADFGERLLAYLIDAMLFAAVSLIYVVPLMIWYMRTVFDQLQNLDGRSPADYSPYEQSPTLDVEVTLPILMPILVLIAATFILGGGLGYLYYVEYQLHNGGQTLGKRVMRLRVVPIDPAQPLTRRDLAMRWLVQHVGAMFIPFFSYLDGLWQLWDKPLRQCLHDKAAKTVVVKEG